jgi:hypothetical protein
MYPDFGRAFTICCFRFSWVFYLQKIQELFSMPKPAANVSRETFTAVFSMENSSEELLQVKHL